MLRIYFGKSASGKDYLTKQDVAKGWRNFVTCTTRPPRPGEVDGVDYWFLSEKEFLKRVETGDIFEYRKHSTTEGEWFYGSCSQKVSQADYVGVLDINGVLAAIEHFGAENVEAVFVEAPENVRRSRYVSRDSKAKLEELERRFAQDEIDFSPSEVERVRNALGKNFRVVKN